MGILNPIENSFIKTLAETQNNLQSVSVVTQPQFVDWLSLNVAETSYISDNNLNISSTAVLNILSNGDKIRIYQGGGYKYFYVYKLDSGTGDMQLIAGSDYTFTNAAYTQIAISKNNRPQGFPAFFNFISSINPIFGTASVTSESFEGKFAITTFPFVLVFDVVVQVTFNNNTNGGYTFNHPVGTGNEPQPLQGYQTPAVVNISTQLIDRVIDAPFGMFDVAYIKNIAADTTSFSDRLSYTYFLDI